MPDTEGPKRSPADVGSLGDKPGTVLEPGEEPGEIDPTRWWAEAFAFFTSHFREIQADGPPPQISDEDQRLLKAIVEPREYFAACETGDLPDALRHAPRINSEHREWIQKNYARELLAGFDATSRAIGAGDGHAVAQTAFLLGADVERYHAVMNQLDHAVRGAKVSHGGLKGASATNTQGARARTASHGSWIEAAKKLDPRLSTRAMARKIAQDHGVRAETVRKALARGKTG